MKTTEDDLGGEYTYDCRMVKEIYKDTKHLFTLLVLCLHKWVLYGLSISSLFFRRWRPACGGCPHPGRGEVHQEPQGECGAWV